jgi:hypothetical protein
MAQPRMNAVKIAAAVAEWREYVEQAEKVDA